MERRGFKGSGQELPNWNNDFLSTYEVLLVGGAEMFEGSLKYREDLSKGIHIPDIHKVRAVLSGEYDIKTINQVRSKKAFLPNVFHPFRNGYDPDFPVKHVGLRLNGVDENGETDKVWQIVQARRDGRFDLFDSGFGLEQNEDFNEFSELIRAEDGHYYVKYKLG